MRTHRLVISLLLTHARTEFTIAVIGFVMLACLTPRADAQANCFESFRGGWISPQFPKGRILINLSGDSADGFYTDGKHDRLLKGEVAKNLFKGNWAEVAPDKTIVARGTFIFVLDSKDYRLNVSFFDDKSVNQEKSSTWLCLQFKKPASEPTTPQPTVPQTSQPAKPEPVEGQTPPQTLQPDKEQTPQIQGPQQGGIQISLPGFGKKNADDHDTDGFKTFDSLPKAAQAMKLAKKGPRLPQQYDVSDLSLRAFVKGGWPIVIDYGLDPGAFAELTITVPGAQPLIMTIDSAKRAQIRITIPDDFGTKPQVAKVRIAAFTKLKEPADFQLYGIAMGEKGVQALRRVNGLNSDVQLATNRLNPRPAPDNEPIPLFAPKGLQTGSSIGIKVNQPTTIKPRQRPPIEFSLTSHSNFSDGRWEFWHASGLRLTQVWEKKTGSISPNQTRSGTWDGIGSGKNASFGNHCLQLTAWHGRESDRDWVVARTRPNLIVIK